MHWNELADWAKNMPQDAANNRLEAWMKRLHLRTHPSSHGVPLQATLDRDSEVFRGSRSAMTCAQRNCGPIIKRNYKDSSQVHVRHLKRK